MVFAPEVGDGEHHALPAWNGLNDPAVFMDMFKELDGAARLTELLSDAGYANVALMFEGWEGWRAAGYPSSSGEEASQ